MCKQSRCQQQDGYEFLKLHPCTPETRTLPQPVVAAADRWKTSPSDVPAPDSDR
jgi:hypothetical protein